MGPFNKQASLRFQVLVHLPVYGTLSSYVRGRLTINYLTRLGGAHWFTLYDTDFTNTVRTPD